MTPERPEKPEDRLIIPRDEKSEIKYRIRTYSSELCKNHDDLIGLKVRFYKLFCTISIYHEPMGPVRSCSRNTLKTEVMREKLRNTPSPLCRLTYVSPNIWTLSIYNFCTDTYDPSPFLTGRMEGTPEEGVETAMEFFYGIQTCRYDQPD